MTPEEKKTTEPKAEAPKAVAPKHEEGILDFLVHNKWDALAYIALFIGLLVSIFERFVGGCIVGVILGFYFSAGVKRMLEQFKEYLSTEGVFKGFVLLASALALFIASPGLVIGAVVGAFVQPYLGSPHTTPPPEEKK